MYRRSDPNYIQGFYYDVDRQKILESTGLYGKSYVQWTNLDHEKGTTEPTDIKVLLNEEYFGEGISKLSDTEFIMLTLRENKVVILDRDTLETVNEIPMWEGVGAGWGITLDPEKRILYVSDGTSIITCVNADTLK